MEQQNFKSLPSTPRSKACGQQWEYVRLEVSDLNEKRKVYMIKSVFNYYIYLLYLNVTLSTFYLKYSAKIPWFFALKTIRNVFSRFVITSESAELCW